MPLSPIETHTPTARTAATSSKLPLGIAAVACLLPLIAAALLLRSDSAAFYLWAGALIALGAAAYPITSRLFPEQRGLAWILAKALGFMLLSLTSWSLSYLKVLPFRPWALYLIWGIALIIGVSRFAKSSPKPSRFDPLHLTTPLAYEAAFLMILLFWTYARGLRPEIDGLEKFMDYGFMKAMERTSYFPPTDMWFAGSPINYYYFGQFAFTMLAAFSRVAMSVAYNLSIATVFAFTATLSFAVVQALVGPMAKRSLQTRIAAIVASATSALLVSLGGNSHSFYYAPNGPGRGLLGLFTRLGANIGQTEKFFFSDSTRFIGHNPDIEDKTIHEFPYYSFLVADLHAHMINLIFVLVFILLLVVLMKRLLQSTEQPSTAAPALRLLFTQESWLSRVLREPAAWLLTLTMAVFMMCNFWDFIIYLVVFMLMMIMVGLKLYREWGGWESLPLFILQFTGFLIPFLLITSPVQQVLVLLVGAFTSALIHRLERSPLTFAGSTASILFAFAHLVALPFSLKFDPISKSMALVDRRTAIYQLFIVWGPHLLVGLVFVILAVIVVIARTQISREFSPKRSVRLAMRLASVDAKDFFIALLWLSAFGLILAPEILYVVDIYGGAYKRANTMFKFTYQAFVMLGLVWGWAVYRCIQKALELQKKQKVLAGIATAVTLLAVILPLWYPISATSYWLNDWSRSKYQGLDGTVQLSIKNSDAIEEGQSTSDYGELMPDYQAIQWLNENVKGQAVVLEANGESYTDYNRISAYTGLPTIMGWQTHEWLWRTSASTPSAYGQVVVPRQDTVQRIYEGQDPVAVKQLLDIYQVEFIVIGKLERIKFPALNEALLQTEGQIVFSYDDLYIIQRAPGYSPLP